MGCDIHFYTERRVDGKWQTADEWTKDTYDPGRMMVDSQLYTSRNYSLFAILADVRNGRGFAGVKTGEGFVPIATPRGVPEDACPEYRRLQEDYGSDGHSHSYFTLQELLEYDWTQTTRRQGVVGVEEWASFACYGKPESWCGSAGGGGIVHHPAEKFAEAWENLARARGLVYNGEPQKPYRLRDTQDLVDDVTSALGGGTPMCTVHWEEPYYSCVSEFLGETVPQLLRLGRPEDVRIVFFFDN